MSNFNSLEQTDNEPSKNIEIRELSGWDLASILQKSADYVKNNQFGVYSTADDDVKQSLGYLVRQIELQHETYQKAMDIHYECMEKLYSEYDAKVSELQRKLRLMPKFELPKIPYIDFSNLEKTLDFVERVNNVPESVWQKVEQVTNCFRKPE